jgi:hypothetical protein
VWGVYLEGRSHPNGEQITGQDWKREENLAQTRFMLLKLKRTGKTLKSGFCTTCETSEL